MIRFKRMLSVFRQKSSPIQHFHMMVKDSDDQAVTVASTVFSPQMVICTSELAMNAVCCLKDATNKCLGVPIDLL